MPLELSKTINASLRDSNREKIELTLIASIAKSDEFASQAGHSVVFICDGVENPTVVPLENGIAQAKLTIPKNQFQYLGPVIKFTAKFTANGDEVSGSINMPIQVQEVSDPAKIAVCEVLNVILIGFAWFLISNFTNKFGWYVSVNWLVVMIWIFWNIKQEKMDMYKAGNYIFVHTFISVSMFVIWIVFRNLASS